MRVRRLLDRLGFLNELPERLQVMIQHRHYKEAVQLYNKTISVLTRHSHVLSFHKIKVVPCLLCTRTVQYSTVLYCVGIRFAWSSEQCMSLIFARTVLPVCPA